MNLTLGMLCCLFSTAANPVDVDRPIPRRLVEKKFDRALNEQISASWHNVSVRKILRAISDDRNITILLDRRVDPTTILLIDLNDVSVLEGLREIGDQLSASVAATGNTVVIGPHESVGKLRTLVQIRRDEIFRNKKTIPAGRRFELGETMTVHYGDLETPRALITRICQRYELEVEGLDRIPHDLWAGATLPDVKAVAALSLILNQFDLTFEWTSKAAGIRIVPMPKVVSIERFYVPRKMSPRQAARDWGNQIVGLKAVPRKKDVAVSGTLEQHEALAVLIDPRLAKNNVPKTDRPVPLSKRLFTLTVRRVPVGALMKKLEEKDVIFKYDVAAMAAAEIDLTAPISLSVKKTTADQFFHAIFDPVGVAFTIDNVTVMLKPK